ncbi:hypothetical protein J6590_008151 [Homalodisca vitripennis]|nr:hypothetical protein J6590_008151 [Homalodisca vitripennis]
MTVAMLAILSSKMTSLLRHESPPSVIYSVRETWRFKNPQGHPYARTSGCAGLLPTKNKTLFFLLLNWNHFQYYFSVVVSSLCKLTQTEILSQLSRPPLSLSSFIFLWRMSCTNLPANSKWQSSRQKQDGGKKIAGDCLWRAVIVFGSFYRLEILKTEITNYFELGCDIDMVPC